MNRLGRQVIALRLNEDGKMMEAISVHGAIQKVFKSVSEVEERDGSLWIGSVMAPFLGIYKLQKHSDDMIKYAFAYMVVV